MNRPAVKDFAACVALDWKRLRRTLYRLRVHTCGLVRSFFQHSQPQNANSHAFLDSYASALRCSAGHESGSDRPDHEAEAAVRRAP